ncbi:DUF5626 family protein [Shouchella clausii]|uniref:DUF5626 family protein n=1 Tax=Shouchella clausii TaxID=79880 RepID=UPI000BA5D8CF|nr:DUF5626 family protein [Shouchella clausii]MCY1103002.1 DUF5626 family protein [Shouchella clausii]MEB5479390.1 DUF5626 family protein [Shouchella clausii]PAD11507.1 hypothetical protein CHH74_20485 [Shouchella clausii]PAD91170.1 hypothetical protein CHH52_16400 [Shouchella clausii]PTL23975.1 hypothetical protein DA802_04885 [Shouchella clausii]
MFKKVFTFVFLSFIMVFVMSLDAFASSSSIAKSSLSENDLPSITFDYTDLRTHTDTVVLEDGTELTVGAEPVINDEISALAALNGTWRIWGDNGLARMEYYIVLRPVSSGSKYTRINSTYGLAVTGRLSSFENEKINVVRRNETSSAGAVVEGYAKFNYLGNQWVSIWTQSGGVRATIKGGKVTTKLY